MVVESSAEVDSIFVRKAADNAGETVVTAKSILVVKAASGESVLKSVSQVVKEHATHLAICQIPNADIMFPLGSACTVVSKSASR